MALTFCRSGCKLIRKSQAPHPFLAKGVQSFSLETEVARVPYFLHRPLDLPDKSQNHNKNPLHHVFLPSQFDWRKDALILDNYTSLYIYPQWKTQSNLLKGFSASEETCLQNDICQELHKTLDKIHIIPRNELDFLGSHISWCSDPSLLNCSRTPDSKPSDNTEKPTEQQLFEIKEKLIDTLPTFFTKYHDYSMYTSSIIFENNIWNQKSQGIGAYSLKLATIRIIATIKYTRVSVKLLKVTTHLDQGCIKVRWSVSGLSNLQSLKIWQYYPGKIKENIEKNSQVTDGLSTFYLNKDGLIYKHVVDNVVPDDEEKVSIEELNPIVAPVGLMSKTEIDKFVYSLFDPPKCDSLS